MFQLEYKKSALKSLKKIDATSQERILKAVLQLKENPYPAGHKKLKGQDQELCRIRVGDYRVIYIIENGELTIFVLTIGHRKDVYRGL